MLTVIYLTYSRYDCVWSSVVSFPHSSTTKIFVGNLKIGTTDQELRQIFEPYGTVTETAVIGNYGFVVSVGAVTWGVLTIIWTTL